MDSLTLKLILTPTLIGAASLAGRRWGQGVGGWLAYALLKWLRWGWDCFGSGSMWRKMFGKKKEPQSPAPVIQPESPELPK